MAEDEPDGARSGELAFIVGDADRGARLDVFLAARMTETTRSQIQRFIDTRAVQVNGTAARSSLKVQTGDLVLVAPPAPPRASHIGPQEIPLSIVYEDSDLLVIDKPKGMVVHPAPGAEDGTLVNALLAYATDLSGIGGVIRPGIVHRLDKDTSGLLVVAKNDAAHNNLQQQIQKKTASRRYLALVWGQPPFKEAVVDAPIGRHPTDRKRMAVLDPEDGASREAVTEIKVVEELEPAFSRIECKLQTGRTHQIRVHCAFAGYPVVGDAAYGGVRKVAADSGLRGPALTKLNERLAALHGQVLHAFRLAFDHPATGKRMAFEAPPPAEIQDLLEHLRALSAPQPAGTAR